MRGNAYLYLSQRRQIGLKCRFGCFDGRNRWEKHKPTYCHDVVPWCFLIVIYVHLPETFLLFLNRKRCCVLVSFLTALQSPMCCNTPTVSLRTTYMKEMGWIMSMWTLH